MPRQTTHAPCGVARTNHTPSQIHSCQTLRIPEGISRQTCGLTERNSLRRHEFGCAMALAAAAPKNDERSMSGVFKGMLTHGVSSMLSRFLTESVLL